MKRSLLMLSMSALLLFAALQAPAASAHRCAQCGMPVDDSSPFSAKIVAGSGDLFFCDIGDLLSYLQSKKVDPKTALVKDFRSGAWITADGTFYVHASKKFMTPMGWDIGAFKDRGEASAYGTVEDISSILKGIK